MSVTRTQVVKFIRKGDKGDKGEQGAVLRGPQAWSDCATGYAFQAGGAGETWRDVVIYGDQHYVCKKSHTKTASNYPGSTTANNNGYWQLGDHIDLVATKILLATYALVKNLGVEAIDMKDANGNVLFQAKDGTVQCRTGVFNDITVQSGQIAGFKISGNGLSNDPFTNDAYVIFRNDAHKCFAGIGGNILPASSGLRAVARFENEDTSDQWGIGQNIAAIFSAKNGAYNFAFHGSGNGLLDGFIGGYKYSKFTISAANTRYTGYTDLKTNNRWIVYCGVSNSGINLPRLSDVRRALGIGSGTNFCIEYTVMADLGATGFSIFGRNSDKDSSGATPWSSTEYPVLTHWNNGRYTSIEMGAGDAVTFMLTYDSSKTMTLDGFGCQYTARMINRQN